MRKSSSCLALTFTVALSACSNGKPEAESKQATQKPEVASYVEPPPRRERVYNASAYIPPQCYTKTQDASGHAYNPCFTCHVTGRAPNYVDDSDLQTAYKFPGPALKNPWTNLFVDRRAAIAKISDDEMLAYVRQSNYLDQQGKPSKLAARLAALPDTERPAYSPDAFFHFDDQGFDMGPDGQLTGWRSYGFYGFPGTFFPTNGSMGDVLIRLPREFQEREDGTFDKALYIVNLAIVEALIKRADVPIAEVDEKLYGVDLDKNGKLGKATKVRFDWAPTEQRMMSYVGRARVLKDEESLPLAAGLFPRGTEFLHSVRYLDVKDGKVQMAARFKELRYARKPYFRNYGQLEQFVAHEVKEDKDQPDALHKLIFSYANGIDTKIGWKYQGYIEDDKGELRPQSMEETAFCLGCHSGIGATTDSVFSFARKIAGPEGWFHPLQHASVALPEPQRADKRYEYALYLERAGAGDEFRGNSEVIARFFDDKHQLKPAEISALRKDVAHLLVPTPERALALDKAYWLVVREQSFRLGRDAVIAPAENVFAEVTQDQPTGIEEPETAPWALPAKKTHTGAH